MSTESPTCCGGCCLNQNFVYDPVNGCVRGPGRYDDPFHSYIIPPNPERLTGQELDILQHTKDIWDKFIALPDKVEYDNKEMQDAIHRVQQLIALRVARRVDPAVWRCGLKDEN